MHCFHSKLDKCEQNQSNNSLMNLCIDTTFLRCIRRWWATVVGELFLLINVIDGLPPNRIGGTIRLQPVVPPRPAVRALKTKCREWSSMTPATAFSESSPTPDVCHIQAERTADFGPGETSLIGSVGPYRSMDTQFAGIFPPKPPAH